MTKRLSRKELERRTRREYILATATRLFGMQGYSQTTMGQIAEEAEFGIGTLYNFFSNKEELYYTLLLEKIEALLQAVHEVAEKRLPVLEKIQGIVGTQLRFFEENKEFFCLFISNFSRLQRTSEKKKAFLRYYQQYITYIGIITRVLQQGVNEKILKDHNPREMAQTLVALVNAFVYYEINFERSPSLAGKLPIILDLFFHGALRQHPEDYQLPTEKYSK